MMFVMKRDRESNRMFCLGVGGLAATYDGYKIDGRDRIPVAIKQVALDRKAAERFEQLHFRGLQTMSGRSHPAIVKFLTFFKGDDGGDGRVRLSFVFERCPMARAFMIDGELRGGYLLPVESRLAQGTTEGCDLTSNPIKMPPYTHREALCVARQLLSALSYLHAALPPIIHRDVKPDNVLIWAAERRPFSAGGANKTGAPASVRSEAPRSEETFLTVKLTDYDTVRRYDMSDLTVGSGTRPFMAPEVDVQTGTAAPPSSSRSGGGGGMFSSSGGGAGSAPKATGTYGPDVDVFSVGATLFFLVTGHAPSPDLKQADWRLRFLGDMIYEAPAHAAQAGNGHGGGEPLPRVPSAGLGLAGTKAAGGLESDVDMGGGGSGSGGIWGATPTPQPAPAAGSSAAAAAAAAHVSILDHFFPPNSVQRAFLKGLVTKAPSAELPKGDPALATGGRRWIAAEALAVLDKWFPDVPRLG